MVRNPNSLAGSALDDAAQSLANMLSKSVTDKTTAAGPNVLGKGLDVFVRETPGGKQVMRKLTWYTLIPYLMVGLAAGATIGWIARGKVKR
jgi:hypothetical protein